MSIQWDAGIVINGDTYISSRALLTGIQTYIIYKIGQWCFHIFWPRIDQPLPTYLRTLKSSICKSLFVWLSIDHLASGCIQKIACFSETRFAAISQNWTTRNKRVAPGGGHSTKVWLTIVRNSPRHNVTNEFWHFGITEITQSDWLKVVTWLAMLK